MHRSCQARIRCIELSESLTKLREDYRKANRTLDKLAADGVEIPSDINASRYGIGQKFLCESAVFGRENEA